jgi:opacity protein-like surface antigen
MLRSGLAAILVLGSGGAVWAADLDIPPPETAITLTPRWEGMSFGGYVAGDWSSGQSVSQNWFAPYPLFSSTAPNQLSSTAFGGGGGVLIGYDKQYGQMVTGIMADYGWLFGNKATNNYSGTITWPGFGWVGQPFSGSYSQQLESLGTARWRIGYAPNNDWLVYGDAGLAYGQTTTSSSLQTNTGFNFSGSRTGPAIGYAVGAGVQYAMGPNWSLGLDGLYYDLGDRDNVAVGNFSTYTNTHPPVLVPTPQLSSRGDFSGFQLRLTAEYQYDGAISEATVLPSTDPNTDVPITVAMRAGYSTGKTQMTLYNGNGSAQLSRLTYNDADTFTAEPYFNMDIPNWGIYLTGFVGFGQQRGGNLQDEDFPPLTTPYSSTTSPLQDGQLEYGVIDVGYNGFTGENYKVGAFVGYTFENDNYNAYNCSQTASNLSICPSLPGPNGINANTLTMSDQFTWNAARIGISGSYKIPGGFTISGNAAWLPYIDVAETNYHWLRMPGDFYAAIPGSGTSSEGYQLEAKANYRISPGFDIGAGVRYWYMSAKGNWNFQDATLNGGSQAANWTNSRLQAFLETGYHF